MEEGEIIHTEVRIYPQDPLIEMLKSAGFKHIRIFKAFDNTTSLTNEDESIIYECRK